jgi:hypothetical protein
VDRRSRIAGSARCPHRACLARPGRRCGGQRPPSSDGRSCYDNAGIARKGTAPGLDAGAAGAVEPDRPCVGRRPWQSAKHTFALLVAEPSGRRASHGRHGCTDWPVDLVQCDGCAPATEGITWAT